MKKSLTQKLFATIALGLCGLSAWAVMPEAGKVYRIINNVAGTAVADSGPTGTIVCSTVNEDNMSQRWLVSAGNNSCLVFQSLGTGMYLKSSNASSQAWSLTSKSSTSTAQLVVSGSDSDFTVKAYGAAETLSMHKDGSSNVVCWTSDNENSHWDFVEISMTEAEIEAALAQSAAMEAEANNEAAYQTALSAMFEDNQCTVLKSSYQSMTDDAIKADANYQALSATLQNMVLKVKNGDWSETGDYDWDSDHAKKYRVQLYEPASEGNAGATLVGIQAHTNMHNPTGILGNSGSNLYVMVEKVPEDENVTLYLGGAPGTGMYNSTTNGTELHAGLNIIPQWSDCSLQYVYYTVATTKYDEKGDLVPNVKVTDYDPIVIHIEGGELNGYFNYAGDKLYTPDTHADFTYTANRAKHAMYDLLGEYVIIHFHLFDTPATESSTTNEPGLRTLLDPEKTSNAQDLREVVRVWDELCFRERTLMGIQSDEELAAKNESLLWNYYETLTGDDVADPGLQYSDYFNNRMMAISMQGDLYMNATTWRTAYNINTMPSIINSITTDSGSTWGPAHEYGHNMQGPIKFAGTTEESNNVFSNVVAYYFGKNTSRSAFPKNQLEIFNQDLTYLEHSTWGTTRMFLQLWLYYHACGHNKKFYPRLYELLRREPLTKSYYLNMRYDQLHFAKMCCIAAQEDLTDYFESWGFFVPLDNYHIGDYANYMATLTKEDAQAVKDEIKAMGFPKNNQIILIDDRPGSTRDSWWGWDISECGPLGGLSDFTNGVQPSGEMSFNINGSSMVVTLGEGASAGVGFLIYDEDGTLLGFSNDYEFPLKDAAIAALISGTAKVYAIGADGTTQEVTNNFAEASVEVYQKSLSELLESVNDLYNVIDPEQRRANWYIEFYAKNFVAAYEAAQAAVNSTEVTKEEVSQLYINLLNEYNALLEHEYATIPFIGNSTYQIINAAYPKKAISAGSKSSIASKTNYKEDPGSESAQVWKFVTVDASANTYYIQNTLSGKYISSEAEKNASVYLTDKKSEAGVFTVTAGDFGCYTILNDGDSSTALHLSLGETMMYWESSANTSNWYLRIIDANEKNADIARLTQLLAESKALLAQAGTITITGENIELTADMFSSNAKCTNTQYGDEFTSFDVLIDNDPTTYFHTNYGSGSNSTDGKNHYLAVDLGEGKSLNSVQINWLNRNTSGTNAAVTNPTSVKVDGSNDGSSWTTITTLSSLPSSSGEAYASPVISDGNDYRYYRIVCTGGAGTDGNGHYYFALAEFGIGGAVETVTPDAQYPDVTVEMMLAVRDANDDAEALLSRTSIATSKLESTYNALLEVYNTLAAAMGVETGIEEVYVDNASGNVVEGIYDLQGRRLNQTGKAGIYIINGQKTLVK